MGQAKNRGTREERVAAAIERETFIERQKVIAEQEKRRQLEELETRLPPEMREKLKAARTESAMQRARMIGTMAGVMSSGFSGPMGEIMARQGALLGAVLASQQTKQRAAEIIGVDSSKLKSGSANAKMVVFDEVTEDPEGGQEVKGG